MDLRPLQSSLLPAVYDAYIEAFSDYSIPVKPTRAQFEDMLRRRGADWPLSVGAFEGNRLVGLQVNAVGEFGFEKVPTAYDVFTGVAPTHRGRGLARAMFEQTLNTLPSRCAEDFVLECIQSNEQALGVYRSLGFQVIRSFECLEIPRDKLRRTESQTPVAVREIPNPDWAQLQDLCTWSPSWQNSIGSMERAQPGPTVLGAYRDETLVAYAALFADGGDLAQFAVQPGRHREGLGSALFAACIRRLGPEAQRIRVVNIPNSAEEDLDFFRNRGAQSFAQQFEMRLPL